MSDELPKALVLRLDSRMGVMLITLFACGGEVANKRLDTAIVLANQGNELRERYPEEGQRLREALDAIAELIPQGILDEMGVELATPNELRARLDRTR